MTSVTAGYDTCPDWAPFFGYMGAASCVVLSNFGSAWGTWNAGVGVCKMGINYPSGIMKNIVPVVMAGVLGIYGMIVAVIITQDISEPRADATTKYSIYNGWAHFAAGLCCGCSCLAAGGTIGMIGNTGVQTFGLKASGGKRAWSSGEGANRNETEVGESSGSGDAVSTEEAGKLYVGMLIMLIFSEALGLYGLIVALIVSQTTYECGKN